MNNNNLRFRFSIRMLSALYATLLALFVIWLSLGNWEFKATFTIPYAIALVLSGWLFVVGDWAIAGVVHATLMLLIAGYCVFACYENLATGFADNPAAGTIAVVTLIIIIMGALAALFGFSSLYVALSRPKK